MTSAVEAKGPLNSVEQSSASSRSSKSNASIAYAVTDGTLVVAQRLLLSIMVLFGYDIHGSHEHGRLSTLQEFIRFVRNLYYILKMIRKWLSLNYNDGIIPEPPVVRRRAANAIFGTKHGLRGNAAHENSDFLAQSAESTTDNTSSYSVSFSTVMNSLFQSFTGYVQDPEMIEVDDAGALSSGKLTNSESGAYASIEEEAENNEANVKQHSSMPEDICKFFSKLDEPLSSAESDSESNNGEFESCGSQKEACQSKEEHTKNAETSTATASLEFDSTGDPPLAWHLHTIPSFHCDTTEEEISGPPVIQK